jgi:surface antigen
MSIGPRHATPEPNSIAIWDGVWIYDGSTGPNTKDGYRNTGHIAYVESVIGDTIFFTEANVQPADQYDGLRSLSIERFEGRNLNENRGLKPNPGSNPAHFWGYIYLGELASANSPAKPVLTVSQASTQLGPGTAKPPVISPSITSSAIPARLPIANTGSAFSVGVATATLSGTVNPGGAATRYWFIYGTSPSLGAANQTPVYNVGSGTTPLSISANIAGLLGNTEYYFQLVAANSSGTVKANITGFRTSPNPAAQAPKPPAAQAPKPTAKPKS